MALKFQDSFTHDVEDDPLVGTTPDVMGTSWLSLFNNSTAEYILFPFPGNTKTDENANPNSGILLHMNYGAVGHANVDIEMATQSIILSDKRPNIIVARYIDSNNFIAVNIKRNATEKIKLYKIVKGTLTLLGTSTNAPASGGDTIKLKLVGTSWKVFINTTEEISVTESELLTKGKSCIGQGDIHNYFSGDGLDDENVWTQVFVTENSEDTFTGEINQLTGIINGAIEVEGTFTGNIGQLTGIIDGVTFGGFLVGDIGQLTGIINGVSTLFTGTLVGNIGQLSGNIIGLLQASGVLNGEINQLNGNIIGIINAFGTMDGIIPQLSGNIFGAGSVIFDSISFSMNPSEISDFRLTWFSVDSAVPAWTFKPIIKPS